MTNRQTKKYKMLIFDMDGTILYTLEDLKNATNYALLKHGLPERTLEEVRRFVGNGIHNLIERAVPVGTSEEQIEAVFQTFGIYYKQHCMDTTRPYEGIVELLQAVRARGYLTSVVSNKVDSAVQDLVQDFFSGLFDYALGEQAGRKKKPAPDSVYDVMRKYELEKDEVVYIGDSDVDFATAKNAEVDCILVEWGFRDRKYLETLGASTFAEKPEDILTILENGVS